MENLLNDLLPALTEEALVALIREAGCELDRRHGYDDDQMNRAEMVGVGEEPCPF